MMQVQHIDHVALTVRDVAQSTQWYLDVLGMERRHAETWGDVPTMVCAGETCLALFPARSQEPAPKRDMRQPPTMLHIAFRVDYATFEQAQGILQERGIDFEFHDHRIAHSIYFDDPDQHRIELTTYDLPR